MNSHSVSHLMLVGATGLVGQAVLQLALDDPRVARVVAPTRRPLPVHPKLENPLVDFDRLPAGAHWWSVDAVICTLGTTMHDAGSRAAFRKVDHDYPLAAAQLARGQGARCFALNSALGANPDSRVFYNRVKGELEQALRGCGYPSLVLVRPGLLGGERSRRRPAEFLSQKLLGALHPVLPPRLRMVPAARVAAVLLGSALAAHDGVRVIESEHI